MVTDTVVVSAWMCKPCNIDCFLDILGRTDSPRPKTILKLEFEFDAKVNVKGSN